MKKKRNNNKLSLDHLQRKIEASLRTNQGLKTSIKKEEKQRLGIDIEFNNPDDSPIKAGFGDSASGKKPRKPRRRVGGQSDLNEFTYARGSARKEESRFEPEESASD